MRTVQLESGRKFKVDMRSVRHNRRRFLDLLRNLHSSRFNISSWFSTFENGDLIGSWVSSVSARNHLKKDLQRGELSTPGCGTQACVGGWLDVLLHKRSTEHSYTNFAAKKLGVNALEIGERVFYNSNIRRPRQAIAILERMFEKYS
jgi:hypothetical protein